jgi:hypothetical protein
VVAIGVWILEIVLVVYVLWLGARLVRAVEGIERLLARAVSQYERKSP